MSFRIKMWPKCLQSILAGTRGSVTPHWKSSLVRFFCTFDQNQRLYYTKFLDLIRIFFLFVFAETDLNFIGFLTLSYVSSLEILNYVIQFHSQVCYQATNKL